MKTTFLVFLFFCFSTVFPQEDNFIFFDEESAESIKADQAIIEIYISTSGLNADSTDRANHKKIVRVRETLGSYGYKSENIYSRSNNFNQMSNENGIYFYANQSYRFVLNDFNIYDQLKNDLINAGVSSMQIMQLWSSHYDKVKNDLYIKALDKAKKKADLIAENIGAQEIQIQGITDNSSDKEIDELLTFENVYMNPVFGGYSERVVPTLTEARVSIKVKLRIKFKFLF